MDWNIHKNCIDICTMYYTEIYTNIGLKYTEDIALTYAQSIALKGTQMLDWIFTKYCTDIFTNIVLKYTLSIALK